MVDIKTVVFCPALALGIRGPAVARGRLEDSRCTSRDGENEIVAVTAGISPLVLSGEGAETPEEGDVVVHVEQGDGDAGRGAIGAEQGVEGLLRDR